MALGAYRQDRMQRMIGSTGLVPLSKTTVAGGVLYHQFYDYWPTANTSVTSDNGGIYRECSLRFDNSLVARTGSETEPKNTSLNYYIYVY